MSELDDVMRQVPIDQIARSLGADPAQVEQAARSAIPALLGGMRANAQDPAGERSLAGALSEHAADDVASVDAIDTDDGQKIVQNIFGGSTDGVISALGGQSGGGGDLVSKLLPILAPIVMSMIARQLASGGGLGGMFGGGSPGAAGSAGAGTSDTSFGSGMAPGQPSNAGGGGLADLLGSILGGGSAGGSGGTPGLDDLLGGVLGGMLGGGKR